MINNFYAQTPFERLRRLACLDGVIFRDSQLRTITPYIAPVIVQLGTTGLHTVHLYSYRVSDNRADCLDITEFDRCTVRQLQIQGPGIVLCLDADGVAITYTLESYSKVPLLGTDETLYSRVDNGIPIPAKYALMLARMARNAGCPVQIRTNSDWCPMWFAGRDGSDAMFWHAGSTTSSCSIAWHAPACLHEAVGADGYTIHVEIGPMKSDREVIKIQVKPSLLDYIKTELDTLREQMPATINTFRDLTWMTNLIDKAVCPTTNV